MVRKHISVSIRASWETVYKYRSESRNVPECAFELCKSIESESDEEWIIDASQGKRKTIINKKRVWNPQSWVHLPMGEPVHNLM
ncbi:hypothetical protein [Leptospira stimsonii]|uniref:Uncharacterized protein n=1 Tax=Leptospira stimsonii TaxID=2202203 RepID=A0A396ZB08_9LEPT|nr:hypothetical protein [Leptospira stimsonii]RHX90798.1 hypothetical protein DLM75_10490 [Leptospira stimsonii]